MPHLHLRNVVLSLGLLLFGSVAYAFEMPKVEEFGFARFKDKLEECQSEVQSGTCYLSRKDIEYLFFEEWEIWSLCVGNGKKVWSLKPDQDVEASLQYHRQKFWHDFLIKVGLKVVDKDLKWLDKYLKTQQAEREVANTFFEFMKKEKKLDIKYLKANCDFEQRASFGIMFQWNILSLLKEFGMMKIE